MARTPAHALAPGEYLRDELEERGWSVEECSKRIGRPIQDVFEILDAKQEITAETASAIADALGTTPEVWLNLQSRYCLYLQHRTVDFARSFGSEMVAELRPIYQSEGKDNHVL